MGKATPRSSLKRSRTDFHSIGSTSTGPRRKKKRAGLKKTGTTGRGSKKEISGRGRIKRGKAVEYEAKPRVAGTGTALSEQNLGKKSEKEKKFWGRRRALVQL